MIQIDDLDISKLHRLANTLVREPFLDGSLWPITIGLCGTLGVGKTRLTQAIAHAAGIDATDVTSPTFTLLQSHTATTHTNLRVLHHLDAYRLNDSDEFWELGVDECWREPGAWTIVEWADRVADEMPDNTIWADMEIAGDEITSPRQLRLRCDDEGIRAWLMRVASKLD